MTNAFHHDFIIKFSSFHIQTIIQMKIPRSQKDQTTQFVETITQQLNNFFDRISSQGYSFQCIHAPYKQDEKAAQLKKSYRIFKKHLVHSSLIDSELGQKARQRFANKVWDQLNEQQKIRFFSGKYLPPLHYLQRLAENVKNKKKENQEKKNKKKLQRQNIEQQNQLGTARPEKQQNKSTNKEVIQIE